MPKRSGLPDPEVTGVHHDSRTVRSGGLFVALPGFKTDGGRFVADAVRRGASVIVAERMPSPAPGVECVLVSDARRALSGLSAAIHGHPSREMIVVGITGTNGKTTTSYLLERIFRDQGFATGVIGTIGYKILDKVFPAPNTTPESAVLQGLLRDMADAGVQAVLMEVSSHGLSLKRVEHVAFDAAVFTNLTRDHLDFHKNFADYFAAKRHLFDLLRRSPKREKFCAVNTDDPYGRKLAKQLRSPRVLSFGISARPDVRAEKPVFGFGATSFLWNGLEVRTNLSGKFNASNVLAGLAVAEGFGFKPVTVLRSLRTFRPVDGRFEVLPRKSGEPAIIVDYAHTDDALRNVLSTLKDLAPRRIITVFGCGGDRDRTKRPLMGKAAAEFSDRIFVTSDNPRSEDPAAIIADILKGISSSARRRVKVEPDRRKAIVAAVLSAGASDAVLIAGKGHETYQIFSDKTVHFSDREEALKILRRAAG
jgi:UDP-N-acetylmuramoyl-L-alanyl-D-glutamate--2,6-diaminopimelate ligase